MNAQRQKFEDVCRCLFDPTIKLVSLDWRSFSQLVPCVFGSALLEINLLFEQQQQLLQSQSHYSSHGCRKQQTPLLDSFPDLNFYWYYRGVGSSLPPAVAPPCLFSMKRLQGNPVCTLLWWTSIKSDVKVTLNSDTGTHCCWDWGWKSDRFESGPNLIWKDPFWFVICCLHCWENQKWVTWQGGGGLRWNLSLLCVINAALYRHTWHDDAFNFALVDVSATTLPETDRIPTGPLLLANHCWGLQWRVCAILSIRSNVGTPAAWIGDRDCCWMLLCRHDTSDHRVAVLWLCSKIFQSCCEDIPLSDASSHSRYCCCPIMHCVSNPSPAPRSRGWLCIVLDLCPALL